MVTASSRSMVLYTKNSTNMSNFGQQFLKLDSRYLCRRRDPMPGSDVGFLFWLIARLQVGRTSEHCKPLRGFDIFLRQNISSKHASAEFQSIYFLCHCIYRDGGTPSTGRTYICLHPQSNLKLSLARPPCSASFPYIQLRTWSSSTPKAVLSHRIFLNSRLCHEVRFRRFIYGYAVSFLGNG